MAAVKLSDEKKNGPNGEVEAPPRVAKLSDFLVSQETLQKIEKQ
jgi:hypothetical protein